VDIEYEIDTKIDLNCTQLKHFIYINISSVR